MTEKLCIFATAWNRKKCGVGRWQGKKSGKSATWKTQWLRLSFRISAVASLKDSPSYYANIDLQRGLLFKGARFWFVYLLIYKIFSRTICQRIKMLLSKRQLTAKRIKKGALKWQTELLSSKVKKAISWPPSSPQRFPGPKLYISSFSPKRLKRC